MKLKKLNQVVAVEKSIKTQANKVFTDAYQNMAKPALLAGLAKTYRAKMEEGDKLPSERQVVQLRAHEVITEVKRNLSELFNIVGMKDSTNCVAKADVIVDGQVLVTGVPATHLLWLEKQLVDLKTFIGKLPTLDPTETWHWDSNQNCHATEPVETIRQKKVEDFKVIVQPTKEHPAQAVKVTTDVLDGYWTTVKFSGAMPAQQVKELFERVEKLQRAVKTSREEANMHEAVELNTSPILDYLFNK
jgi:hypothetical protein